jgi:hypothetical protein
MKVSLKWLTVVGLVMALHAGYGHLSARDQKGAADRTRTKSTPQPEQANPKKDDKARPPAFVSNSELEVKEEQINIFDILGKSANCSAGTFTPDGRISCVSEMPVRVISLGALGSEWAIIHFSTENERTKGKLIDLKAKVTEDTQRGYRIVYSQDGSGTYKNRFSDHRERQEQAVVHFQRNHLGIGSLARRFAHCNLAGVAGRQRPSTPGQGGANRSSEWRSDQWD